MHHCHLHDFKRRFFVSLFLTVPILFLSFYPVPHGETLLFLLSSVVFFYGGWPFLKGMYFELKELNPGMMTLIALAIVVSYFYSVLILLGLEGMTFFWELVTLIDIMLLGHWIEMKAVMSAGKSLEALAHLLPNTAHLIDANGNLADVPLKEIVVGNKVLVKPGEKIPSDGTVVSGSSYVNFSLVTGESAPVKVESGESVVGGALNGEGSLTVEVKRTGKDTFISQVIELVKNAQSSRSRTETLANRAAFWLTAIAVIGGALTFFAWYFISNQPLAFCLERTVSVMVITCPHALGLAIPLVVAVSTSLAAAKGLLIRDRAAFENARDLKFVIFDKTGTLTTGEFGINQVRVLDPSYTEEEILRLARGLEAHSEHPIGKAIAKSEGTIPEVDQFEAIAGSGVKGIINGKSVIVASPAYVQTKGHSLPDISTRSETLAVVLVDDRPVGLIGVSDKVRPESKEAVSFLKEMGIESILLTGDREAVAKDVADQVGIQQVFAGVLPDQKIALVKQVQKGGNLVAMCGDGINDAPALAGADLGIAIGAGTDVAIEAADVILVKSNPLDVVSLVRLARSTYRKMVENLIWATGYNLIALPIAAGILYPFGIVLSPAVAAVFMSLSTVICAVNAKLLRY